MTDERAGEFDDRAHLGRVRGDQLVRMFLDQTLMGVLLIDEAGRVVEWNTACERLTGMKRESVLGRSHADVQFDIAPPERRTEELRKRLHGVLEQALRTGKPFHVGANEFRYRSHDGSEIFGEQIFYPIRTDQGFAFASVIQDITKRKVAEQQKQALEAQLAHSVKMEAIGRLAGGMAHDFNNLLTAILGYTSLLMARSSLEDDVIGELQEIESAAQRAAALTSQLLAFCRRHPVDTQLVDIAEVVRGVSRMLSRVLGEDLTLEVRAGSAVPVVRVDPRQLEQALLNLAVNARDAMQSGGKLTVESSEVTVDEGYCRTCLEARPGRYACVAVTDTGCGMAPEVMAHIFEPFFTIKERGKGTGLGLSTVYGFVKQAGGFVNVYSEVGRGTVMRLYFPEEHGSLPRPSVSEPKAAPTGAEHILVAEDESTVRELLLRVLRDAGYTVFLASRPSEAIALAACAERRIDLLLTDMVMPDMGGRELGETLRSTRPGLRILFMSGYPDQAMGDSTPGGAQSAFIGKPFTIDALLRKIRETLDLS